MPSTADGAETPHVEINIRTRHHRQRNKVACKQQGNHMVMQQEGTSNKHQGPQRRATRSCCYDITLRQPIDRQTERQTDRQIGT